MKSKQLLTHKFILNNLKVGDSFLGCNSCWWRSEVGEVMKPICPECRNRLNVYVVNEEDLK